MTAENFYFQTCGETLRELDEELETLRAFERDAAFQAEARPVPEGLLPIGLPAGHIALRGEFPTPAPGKVNG